VKATLTTREAVALGYLSSERQALADRAAGKGPPYVRRGRWVVYRLRDLEAWLDRNTVRTEAALPPGQRIRRVK